MQGARLGQDVGMHFNSSVQHGIQVGQKQECDKVAKEKSQHTKISNTTKELSKTLTINSLVIIRNKFNKRNVKLNTVKL
jgi:hypothetical protein